MANEIEKRVMFGSGGRDYSVDVMRCISCFFVVATHTCSVMIVLFPYDEAIGVPSEWLSVEALKCLVVSATNLFLMISGIFFLSPEREVTISKIWSKNILKMTCAYIIWCVIYALVRIYYMNPQPFSWEVLFHESVNREFHLWYIPMMIGIYIVVPIMRPFTAKAERKHYLYLIGLMIGGMTLYTFNAFTEFLDYTHIEETKTLLEYSPMSLLCQYPFYCILGYFLYTYKPKLSTRIVIYILGIAGWLFTIWGTTYIYVETGVVNPYPMQDKFIIGILAKNTALFVFVINLFSKIRMAGWFKAFISKLSAATLFIYLSHVAFLHLFIENGWFLDGRYNYVLLTLVCSLAVYFAGFIISLLFLQLIPWTRMRNVILDAVWPRRKIWTGGRSKKQKERIAKKLSKETGNAG
ncbi:MAG: acyltransferase [Bacillota bacterium]